MLRTSFLVFATAWALGCNASPSGTPTHDAAPEVAAREPDPALKIPLARTITSTALSAPVDVIRDQWGTPHIYGATLPDVSYAEGYMMASDRMLEMDFGRAEAEGKLASLGGGFDASLLQDDIQMRMHHLESTAQTAFSQLKASSDPNDKNIAQSLTSFAAGVNQWLADVKSGAVIFPKAIEATYPPKDALPWTEVDSIALSYLQAFELAFDADTELTLTQIDAQGAAIFDDSTDKTLAARKGIAQDFEILSPFDATYTLPSGWTGFNGDTSTALRKDKKARARMLAVLDQDRRTMRGVGNDHMLHPSRGSNNFIIGPKLSQTGHVLVANDTHLSLSNPPIFYLVHIVVTGSAPL